MRSIRFFLSTALLLATGLPTASAGASPVQAPHVSVELLSEQRTIQAGTKFNVGLRFVLEPGWHLYWTNPGDSGEPPAIHWSLPSGISAGSILWPYPERAQMDSIVNYVYSGQVLLPVPMQAGELQGPSVPITADVRWLVCRDICIPGKASVKAELPVGREKTQPDPSAASTFAATHLRIPQPLPGGVRTRTVDDGKQFTMTVSPLKSTGKSEFFPLVAEQVDNSSVPKLESSGDGIRISLVKSDQLLKPIHELSGVL